LRWYTASFTSAPVSSSATIVVYTHDIADCSMFSTLNSYPLNLTSGRFKAGFGGGSSSPVSAAARLLSASPGESAAGVTLVSDEVLQAAVMKMASSNIIAILLAVFILVTLRIYYKFNIDFMIAHGFKFVNNILINLYFFAEKF
jgi:hypothetical protein